MGENFVVGLLLLTALHAIALLFRIFWKQDAVLQVPQIFSPIECYNGPQFAQIFAFDV